MRRQFGREAELSVLLWLGWVFLTCEGFCDVTGSGSHPCNCRSHDGLLIIDCRRMSLNEVPQFYQDNQLYDELTLAANIIGELKNNDFQHPRVKKLDLSENSITQIQSGAFNGLNDDLEELILHVSSISTFPSSEIGKLTNLKRLYMRGFRISSLNNGDLSPLTSLQVLHITDFGLSLLYSSHLQAQRDTLVELNLAENSFSSVPTSAIESLNMLQKLVISENNINSLGSHAFGTSQRLNYIDISQNTINSINSRAFENVEDTLTVLVMTHCSLGRAQLSPLTDLAILTTLNLAHNNIDSIPDNFFHKMNKLEMLDLDFNQISSLHKNTFTGLDPSMKTMHIQSNSISNIGEDTFYNLLGLEELYLSTQPFANSLGPNTFRGLEQNLLRLELKDTGFTAAHWSSINGLSRLDTVVLWDNSISSVPDGTFRDMNYLRVLEIKNNQLQTLTHRAMYDLRDTLQEVRVDGNQIQTIDHCVFAEFTLLKKLNLNNNPLHCDCHMRWSREWLDDNSQTAGAWKCDSPDEHKNKEIEDMHPEDFVCDGGDGELVECADLRPTTPSTTTPHTSTGGEPQPLGIWIANVTDTTMRVVWTVVTSATIERFTVEYFPIDTPEEAKYSHTGPEAREETLTGLTPAMEYMVCVDMVVESGNPEKNCATEKTPPTAGAVTQESNSTLIIVASVLGVIAAIIIVIAIVYCYARYRRRQEKQANNPFAAVRSGGVPSVGYNSKRFSKPKSGISIDSNVGNETLVEKLEQFSPEERDRIINLLTNSGASTMSMISTGSRPRYVPDLPPRPQAAMGYLNPVSLKDEDPDKHVYYEIPDDNYEQIPADKVGLRNSATTSSVYI